MKQIALIVIALTFGISAFAAPVPSASPSPHASASPHPAPSVHPAPVHSHIPLPAPFTPAQRQAAELKRAPLVAGSILPRVSGMYSDLFQMVWHNNAGLTPQQVLDAQGTSGKKLVDALGALQGAMTALGAKSIPSAPHTITVSPTGMATVGK